MLARPPKQGQILEAVATAEVREKPQSVSNLIDVRALRSCHLRGLPRLLPFEAPSLCRMRGQHVGQRLAVMRSLIRPRSEKQLRRTASRRGTVAR